MQEKNWVILIPIWGDSHIAMCANFLLPSLLATGNLPALNSGTKPMLRFLTTKPSSGTIEKLKLFPALSKVANVNFCYIDDLVNIGNYGFTLTIAYERGVQVDLPEDQVSTCYIFLNGDFVLSNSSFVTLSNKISEGYNAIVCPSLRVNEQDVFPALSQAVKNDTLDLPGRELVRLSLDNLHPTVVGAMVNSTSIGTSISHQYFARANKDVLLARFFLVFMFCIKPENPLPTVTSHCDYSFVPEMCPSGNFTVITDSDDAFLMELSPIEQESSYIYLGRKDLSADATRMQKWVTKEHFAYSQSTLCFHANELSAADEDGIKHAHLTLQNTLDNIYTQLNNSPRASHIYHPFWNDYLNVLKSQGQLTGRKSISKHTGMLSNIVNWCTKKFLGLPPFVTSLHYKYLDYFNCCQTLSAALASGKIHKVLYVCGDNKDLFKRFFVQHTDLSTDIIRIDDLVNVQNINYYDLIFIEANQRGFNRFAASILANRIQPSNTIVFIDLVSNAWQHNNIIPYLCLLNDKINMKRSVVSNSRKKWLYYKASTAFMRELHGNKNFLKMSMYLSIFAYSAISLAIINKFRPNQQSSNLENLSSIVLSFK